MIEITHKQAQHLIREGLDRRLPDAQWAVLQSHLERCAECTAYRQRLAASQRGLTHALRLRWSAARGPRPGAAQYLVSVHQRREQRKAFMSKALRYGLVVLLLLAYLGYRRITDAPEPQVQIEPTPPPGEQLATAGALDILFRGLVAFVEEVDGSAEIMLLNASGGQVDRSNLTNHPAADTHPAWSPDGEWLAFLSDRSGKNEIYLMTVAGSRLTQITADPAIDWQGPLEWAPDGSYIALTGLRADAGGDPFLFLVPTSGTEPRAVAYTRGLQPWLRFSPSLPLLAIPSLDPRGGLAVVSLQSGLQVRVAAEDTGVQSHNLPRPQSFDWSLGGTNLVYVSERGMQVRMTPDIDANQLLNFNFNGVVSIASADRPGTFRAVTTVPNSLLVASLEDQENDGCWTVRIDNAYNRLVSPRRLSGLCVVGGMERSNWTGDGNWLVLLARAPEEMIPALYAVRVPDTESEDPRYERLGDILSPASEETDRPLGPAFEVRRVGRRLALNPRPAESLSTATPSHLAGPFPPEGGAASGWIYYTASLGGERAQIFRARPSGDEAEALTGGNANLMCPRAGPDGRVAYVSDMGRPEAGASEIFIMDADGQNHNLLTRGGGRFYDCAVWSPDGTRIAAYSVDLNESTFALSIIQVPAGITGAEDAAADAEAAVDAAPAFAQPPEPTHLPVDYIGLSEPVWLPNDPADPAQGADRVLVMVPQSAQPARLLEFNLAERAVPRERAMLTGWDDIWGLTLSPDGQRLAGVLIFFNRRGSNVGPSAAQLRVLDVETLDARGWLYLNNFDADTAGQGGLAWLSNSRIGLLRSTGLIGTQKSVLEILTLTDGGAQERLRPAARFKDVVFDAAWGAVSGEPDRAGWVIFTAESGLWALDLQRMLVDGPFVSGDIEAAQIFPDVIVDVDWR